MTPVVLIKRTKINNYIAIKDLNSGGLLNLNNELSMYYQSPKHVTQLMKLGTIDNLGKHPVPSTTEQKYGFDFLTNHNYQQLPYPQQIQAEENFIDNDNTNSLYLGRNDDQEAPTIFKTKNLYQWCSTHDLQPSVLYQNKTWYVLYPNIEHKQPIQSYAMRILNKQAINAD